MREAPVIVHLVLMAAFLAGIALSFVADTAWPLLLSVAALIVVAIVERRS